MIRARALVSTHVKSSRHTTTTFNKLTTFQSSCYAKKFDVFVRPPKPEKTKKNSRQRMKNPYTEQHTYQKQAKALGLQDQPTMHDDEADEHLEKFNAFFESVVGKDRTQQLNKKIEQLLKEKGVGSYSNEKEGSDGALDDEFKDLNLKQEDIEEMMQKVGIPELLENFKDILPEDFVRHMESGDVAQILKDVYGLSDDVIQDLSSNPDKIEEFVNNYSTPATHEQLMDKYKKSMETDDPSVNQALGNSIFDKFIEEQFKREMKRDGHWTEEDQKLETLFENEEEFAKLFEADEALLKSPAASDLLRGMGVEGIEDDDDMEIDLDQFEEEFRVDDSLAEDTRNISPDINYQTQDDNSTDFAEVERETKEEEEAEEENNEGMDELHNEELKRQQEYYAQKMQLSLLKSKRKKLRKSLQDSATTSTGGRSDLNQEEYDEEEESDDELAVDDSGGYFDEITSSQPIKSPVQMKEQIKEIRERQKEEEEAATEKKRIKNQERLGIRQEMVEAVRQEEKRRRKQPSTLKLFNFSDNNSNKKSEADIEDDERDRLTPRQRQIARKVQEALSHIMRYEFQDPRVSAISIQYVEMSKDLRNARVKWTTAGKPLAYSEMDQMNKILNKRSGFLASKVGQLAELRFAPLFKFYFDARGDDPTAPEQLKPGHEQRRLLTEIALQYDLTPQEAKKFLSTYMPNETGDTEFRQMKKKSNHQKGKNKKKSSSRESGWNW